jgi:3-oxoadipate enol-lactonase/4-carboxymuconolactone decarboxylase
LPYLDQAGARLFYTVDGPEDAPVIVFSNSLGTDHTMWQPQADALAGRFRVVRYDMRGHGRSTTTETSLTVETLGATCWPSSMRFTSTRPCSAAFRWAV